MNSVLKTLSLVGAVLVFWSLVFSIRNRCFNIFGMYSIYEEGIRIAGFRSLGEIYIIIEDLTMLKEH